MQFEPYPSMAGLHHVQIKADNGPFDKDCFFALFLSVTYFLKNRRGIGRGNEHFNNCAAIVLHKKFFFEQARIPAASENIVAVNLSDNSCCLSFTLHCTAALAGRTVLIQFGNTDISIGHYCMRMSIEC